MKAEELKETIQSAIEANDQDAIIKLIADGSCQQVAKSIQDEKTISERRKKVYESSDFKDKYSFSEFEKEVSK